MATQADEKPQVVSGLTDEDVQEAISLIATNSIVHNRHEGMWRAIQQLFEATFFIQDPTGTKRISSKLLLQVLWRVVNKLKIPDFRIYRAGPFALPLKIERDKKTGEFKNVYDKDKAASDAWTRDIAEQLVTIGVSTVMKEGKFNSCMDSKGGVFYKAALFGDAHLDIGYDEDNSDYPIRFRVPSLSDTYLNTAATDLVDPVDGLGANGKVTIYRYTMKAFKQMWPDFADKVVPGEIPRNLKYRKQLEKTWLQTTYEDDDIIEVGEYTSIEKTQVTFAGKACTVLRKFSGEEDEGETAAYPYIMDGKPYLNTLHFGFFPSTEGYFNYGIGHMLFDIALLAAKMDEMAYNHAGDNIWPITFVNSTTKNTSKVFQDILKAQQMRTNGGRGYVVSDNVTGTAGVTVESFQSQPITQEWERAFTRLEQQVERLGFPLDGPDLGANPNQMSIMYQQEMADGPIKQVIQFNASSFFQRAVDITIDFMRKFIDDDNQTPINSMTDIDLGDGNKMPVRSIPLGWIAKELRTNKYFVVVNDRDGTVPSNVAELARVESTLVSLPLGTPAWNKAMMKKAQLNGQNLSAEDLAMQQAAPAPEAGQPQGMPLSETTPLNAYSLKHGTPQGS